MKQILRVIRRPLVWLFISLIYALGCLCYDKKYLVGRHFDRWHFTQGWRWILYYWFGQKVLGKNGHVPWPIPPYASVIGPENIIFDPDDMHIFHIPACYFLGLGGKVVIGKSPQIAVGCGFVAANHDFKDISKLVPGEEVVLGEKYWIAMNAVILPGVHLGPHTIVGAGSVVTKSFPEGNCVIAGNPARKIKDL